MKSLQQRLLGYPRHEYEEETFLSDDMVQESLRVDEEAASTTSNKGGGPPSTGTTSMISAPLALDLSHRNISTIDKTISGYNLSTLILNNNKIDKVMGLETLVNLRRLDLSFNLIRRIEGLGSLTNLEVLSFYHNQITEIDGMERCRKLRSLSLGRNLIAFISQKGLKQLENMSQLKDLNLSHNPVCTTTEIYKETILDVVPHLRYLDNHMIPLDWTKMTNNRNEITLASYDDHHQKCSIQNIIDKIDQISMDDKDADHDSTTGAIVELRSSISDILGKYKSCIDDIQVQVSRSIQDLESLLKSKVLTHLQDVERNIMNNKDNVNDDIMLMELEFMQCIHLAFESWNKEFDANMNTIRNQASATIEECNKIILTSSCNQQISMTNDSGEDVKNDNRNKNTSMTENIAQAIHGRIQSLHQNSVSIVEGLKEEIYRKHRIRVQQIVKRIKKDGVVEDDGAETQCRRNEQTS